MSRPKKIFTCDAETDPFLHGRVPKPFMWGLYDGKTFRRYDSTDDFIAGIIDLNCILYAHNGGKFDFIYLIPYIKQTRAQVINGRIVSMFLGRAELRDSYAIIPEPLRKIGAKKEIEYWKLEADERKNYDTEIEEYLKTDCVVLYDAVTRYRSIAGKHKTIASNALAFARKLGIDPGKTSHSFDREYRKFFFGGRCECFRPGTHTNIHMLDIHSAYPFAMSHLHATGTRFYRRSDLKTLSHEQIQRSFIELLCFSKGAFPIRSERGELSFPHAEGVYNITGWEYLAAKEFDLIADEHILTVRYCEDTIDFKPYIDHWFAYKDKYSAKDKDGKPLDPMNYTIGKIMQNSLYGKLAQDPTRYYDYRFAAPGTHLCTATEFRNGKCITCGEKDTEHGWNPYLDNPEIEIHRREALWQLKYKYGIQWEGQKIYNNVATGASITGFTRAHLLRAAHAIGRKHIIYCDTDSLICDSNADISRVPISPNLGDWGYDGKGLIGHFAGKKLYGIKLESGGTKIASKGSRLNFETLADIINGKTAVWKNDPPSFRIDGKAKFVHREIRATALNL
ncbi:MAG: hypothetical protein KGJ13_04975 [Patescibacteria group bacterium]|nr:hypothetical protein [Patescibacteria group bacterium]